MFFYLLYTYKNDHIAFDPTLARMARPISDPPPKWRTDLNETDRKILWKEAAGEGKSLEQHKNVRKRITCTANEDAAKEKNGVGLTPRDKEVLSRSSKKAASNHARLERPGKRAEHNAMQRANMKKPENRKTANARSNAHGKAKRDTLQAERAADFEAKGIGVTTEFGLGDVVRADEIDERVHDIMHSSAGVFQYMGTFEGEATCDNWVRDHGEYTSIKEVIATGEWAAYFLVTKQKITSGKEIKCSEPTNFMSNFLRDPLWRIETHMEKPKHINEEIDLRLFTPPEAKTVARSYMLAKCVSGYDATSIEGGLQRYIEKMGMPHGMCLHRDAGAGSQKEYGTTNPETTWVVLSLIRVKDRKFADVDPVDPNRSPPLTSCTVTSHDGKTDYKVAVRGGNQKFPSTKSVLQDEAKVAAKRLQDETRRNKRKADAISKSEDDQKLSE